MLRLIEYLRCLPVDLLSIDKIEADDVIGYITNKSAGEVYIMSADQDFMQLVSDRVTIYSPIKKKFYTPTLVKEEYSLYPSNFINKKILMGDDSDNIPGVKGLGPKKLFKLFPELESPTHIPLRSILEKSKESIKEHGLYGDIVNFEKQLLINKLDKLHFLKLYNEDKLGNSIPNTEIWLNEIFSYLQVYKLK